jgi:predicted ATPase
LPGKDGMSLSLPPRAEELRGVLQERLRPLQAHHRQLLMHAAAIGRRFDADVLAAVVSRTPAQIRTALRRACTLQVLEVVDRKRGTFAFRHALTRDAIYDQLVAVQLRPLHREIGAALERLGTVRHAPLEELAYHWWAAGDRRRGCRYNEEAGDRASAIHAEADALKHYGRALDLLGRRSAARTRIEGKVGALRACEDAL